MTVGELTKYLSVFAPETPIVMSRDAEGNGFSPLDEAQMAFYCADSTYSGDVWQPNEEDAETDEDVPEGYIPAVCFWPVN